MNVLFHTATAIATVVLITDTNRPLLKMYDRINVRDSFLALFVGIIFHGILDYMPHRYPVNSKIDAIASLFIFIAILFWVDKKYKLIIVASFLGNILPDLIDLLPGILNKYFSFNIPILPKIFPWHWPEYSGSIYKGGYNISNLNHLLVLLFVLIICLVRYKDFREIFIRNSSAS